MQPIIRNIDDFVAGDTYKLDRVVTSVVPNTFVAGAWWTAKETYGDPDSLAKFLLHITTVSADVGIVVNNSDGTVRLLFVASPEATIAMDPMSTYYYDVQLLLSDNSVHTIEMGKLFTLGSITDIS